MANVRKTIIRVVQVTVQRPDSYDAMGLDSYEQRINRLKSLSAEVKLMPTLVANGERSAIMVVHLEIDTLPSFVTDVDNVLTWEWQERERDNS